MKNKYTVETEIEIPKSRMMSRYMNHPDLDFMLEMKMGESVFIYPTEEEYPTIDSNYDYILKKDDQIKAGAERKSVQVRSFLNNNLKPLKSSQYFMSRKELKEGKLGHRWFCIKNITEGVQNEK